MKINVNIFLLRFVFSSFSITIYHVYLTHPAALNTVIDDVTNYVTQRIFNTN